MSNKYFPVKQVVKSNGIKNTFFPGITGFGMPDPNAKLQANIINNAKNLNQYRAPYQVVRVKVDTSFWRSAVNEAERPASSLPYRVQMQTIYLDTVLNGHVSACMRKRKDLSLLKKFHLCDESDITNKAATAILESNQWFQLCREYIHDAQYYGYSLITFGDLINGALPKLTVTRRTDVSPDRECLSTMPYIPTGINFNDPSYQSPDGGFPFDWSLWVTTPTEDGISTCGYGMLYKVALYEIIMRSLIGWNTDYTERYGMPTAVVKTVDNSNEERDRAEEAAQKLGSSGYLILNTNDEYELVSGDQAGTGWKSYDNLETRCKKAISTIILGHEDGIASSGGKMTKDDDESPQAKALIEKETTDCRFEENVINDLLIPKLIKLGFNIPIGLKYKIKNDAELIEENENKAKRAKDWSEVAMNMTSAGLKVDATEFSELSGMKIEEAPAPATPVNPAFSNRIKAKLNKTYASTKKEKGK